jgi:GNAT superfamily N-acetyltransferase
MATDTKAPAPAPAKTAARAPARTPARSAARSAALASKRKADAKVRLEIRQATRTDRRGIVALVRRAYGDGQHYTSGQIVGQMNNFPEGCFVAVLDGTVVGYCATLQISGEIALGPHSWDEITGNGFGSRHDPTGDWLYGYEMVVDPSVRGARIGRRLYEERRALAEEKDLTGIAFGGRMPGFVRARRSLSDPQDYLDEVIAGKRHDPVVRFHLANGFEPIGILADYLPEDDASRGYATHMVWRNPYVERDKPVKMRVPRGVESVRLATCQLQARAVKSYDEFMKNVEYFIDVASDYEADFIVFPEMFTLQLLSMEEKELSPAEAIDKLSRYTPRIREALSKMAMRFNINIIGGSHPTRMDDGDIHNVA